MKETYRVRGEPEIAHNANLKYFKNKEELLEMLNFGSQDLRPLNSARWMNKKKSRKSL